MAMTFSYEGRNPYKPTAMKAKTEKRVREWRDSVVHEKLDPWRLMGTRPDMVVRVTMHSGKVIPSQGVRFEGQIRDLFWSRTFMPPFLEDAIEGVLQEVARICREHGLPPEDYLTEAAAYLKGMVWDVYHEMGKIDGVLTRQDYGYERPDLFEYVKPMLQRVEDHRKAAKLLAESDKVGRKSIVDGTWTVGGLTINWRNAIPCFRGLSRSRKLMAIAGIVLVLVFAFFTRSKWLPLMPGHTDKGTIPEQHPDDAPVPVLDGRGGN
jgi:hypothetical protein